MRARPVILVLSQDAAGGALARALTHPAHALLEARSVSEAEMALGQGNIEAVVVDLAQAREALELLHLLPEAAPDVALIAVQPRGGHDAGIEALRLGASWVVEREDDAVALRAAVSRAIELHGLRREVTRLRRETGASLERVPLMGRSEVVRALRDKIDDLAGRAGPVVLLGPPGTGRQSIARDLHARSPRAGGPFIPLACEPGMDETLLESQLFGHRRGAFPGAAQDRPGACRLAQGGSVFLQGIDVVPQRIQLRLLDVIKTGRSLPVGAAAPSETDFRFMAAGSSDLEDLARAGRFRDDLRAALAPGTLRIPPLRARHEDILFLAEAYASEEAERLGVAHRKLDADTLALLTAHSWPGNVRELRAAIRHAFGASLGEHVRPDHLPSSVRAGARVRGDRELGRLPTLAESEADLVALALEECDGNKTLAARRLGVDRKRLYRKIRRYGLALPGEDEAAADDTDEAD